MPRVSKVETCFICGELPCVCGRKSKAKSKPAVKTAAPQVKSLAERMRAARDAQHRAAEAPSATTAPANGHSLYGPKPSPSRDIEELAFEEAIRVIHAEFGLHEDDVAQFRTVLTGQLSTEERLELWNWRRKNA